MNRRSFLKLLISVPAIGTVVGRAVPLIEVDVIAPSPITFPPSWCVAASPRYAVFENFDLTAFGNRIPSFELEIECESEIVPERHQRVRPAPAFISNLREQGGHDRHGIGDLRYSVDCMAWQIPDDQLIGGDYRVVAMYADGKQIPLSSAQFA
jgi:hypothetical protein